MQTLRRCNNKKGMTLVEVLIAGVIMVALIGVSISMLLSSNRLFAQNARLAQYQQLGSLCLDTIADELRYASFCINDTSLALEGIPEEARTKMDGMFYLSTDGSTALARGSLYRSKGGAGGAEDVLGAALYAGARISFTLNSAPNALTITLQVWEGESEEPIEGETPVYTEEKTFSMPNCPSPAASPAEGPVVIVYG